MSHLSSVLSEQTEAVEEGRGQLQPFILIIRIIKKSSQGSWLTYTHILPDFFLFNILKFIIGVFQQPLFEFTRKQRPFLSSCMVNEISVQALSYFTKYLSLYAMKTCLVSGRNQLTKTLSYICVHFNILASDHNISVLYRLQC